MEANTAISIGCNVYMVGVMAFEVYIDSKRIKEGVPVDHAQGLIIRSSAAIMSALIVGAGVSDLSVIDFGVDTIITMGYWLAYTMAWYWLLFDMAINTANGYGLFHIGTTAALDKRLRRLNMQHSGGVLAAIKLIAAIFFAILFYSL